MVDSLGNAQLKIFPDLNNNNILSGQRSRRWYFFLGDNLFIIFKLASPL